MEEEIKNYIEKFKNWLEENGERARAWKEERKNRENWYKEKLSYGQIDDLTVDDFSKLIKDLWASAVWHNKDYKVQYLINNNGLEKIKKELKELLHSKDKIEKRWDIFKDSIKGLGPSSISEILTFFNPQEYPLINLKIYKVLPRIGIPVQIVKDGKSYKNAIEALKNIKIFLVENDIVDVDFIITDFFIAYLFYEVFDLAYERGEALISEIKKDKEKEIKQEVKLKKSQIDTHELAEATLLALGNLLAFDTYTPDGNKIANNQKLGDLATLQELPYFASERIMESAQNIDVIWLKDEWPECFFEVEHTTGVTPGLLRIYQVGEKLSSKCFIIGPATVLKRFEREVEKSPFNKIKEKYRFKSYEELEKMYFAANSFKEASDGFLEK